MTKKEKHIYNKGYAAGKRKGKNGDASPFGLAVLKEEGKPIKMTAIPNTVTAGQDYREMYFELKDILIKALRPERY